MTLLQFFAIIGVFAIGLGLTVGAFKLLGWWRR